MEAVGSEPGRAGPGRKWVELRQEVTDSVPLCQVGPVGPVGSGRSGGSVGSVRSGTVGPVRSGGSGPVTPSGRRPGSALRTCNRETGWAEAS